MIRPCFGLSLVLLFLLSGCRESTSPPKAGPPAQIVIMAGNTQQAVVGNQLGQTLEVRIADAAGRPVIGQLVVFRVVAGGGSLLAGDVLTDGAGVAAARWTLGPAAGEQVVEARASGGNAQAEVMARFS